MGQLSDALLSAGRQLEARLANARGDLIKEGLEGALPQCWRFITESESASLRISPEWSVSVIGDVAEHPDVIIQWSQPKLVGALLAGRSNEIPRVPPPQIRFTSDRGRKAFSLLGTSLGL